MLALRVLVTVIPVSFFQLRTEYSGTHSAVGNNSAADTKADFSQEPVVFEYIHESMRYEIDGSGVRETQAKIRVQTNAGLNFTGQLAFNSNAADEQLEIIALDEQLDLHVPNSVTLKIKTQQALSPPYQRKAIAKFTTGSPQNLKRPPPVGKEE
jgi:hypothetical protein